MNPQKYLYLIQQIGSVERSINNDSLTQEQYTELYGALKTCEYATAAARTRGIEIENAIASREV